MKNIKNKVELKGHSDFSVTYKFNKTNGIFNWYPYTEGFSKPFVDKMLSFFKVKDRDLIMDPFSGCGTTALACSLKKINSLSIEINPFMNFIGKTKTESLFLDTKKLNNYLKKIKLKLSIDKEVMVPSFLKNKPFFNEHNLKQALIIKEIIKETIHEKDYRDFFLLHISSLLVKISNMIRAVDLRYRKIKQENQDVFRMFLEKVANAIGDLKQSERNSAKSIFIHWDICNLNRKLKDYLGKIDYFITSPPYLNGTNYDRNTKLELGFMEMIREDKDLRELRTKMVTAGINSTHTKNEYPQRLTFISNLIKKVQSNAYDRRIPIMVKGYFNDMNLAIKNIFNLMKKNGRGVIVVGDSQFGGVHIETDIILAKICEINGFKIEGIDVVRKRRSKNGMELRESLIFVRK